MSALREIVLLVNNYNDFPKLLFKIYSLIELDFDMTLLFWKSGPKYVALDDKDVEDGIPREGRNNRRRSSVFFQIGTCSFVTLTLLLLLSIIPSWLVFFRTSEYHTTLKQNFRLEETYTYQTGRVCNTPVVRKEWRTLSDEQKLDYVTAVRCLAERPSILNSNATRYDDFPWVHKQLATETHVSAPFLPWHRAYIQVYENALKEECQMQGNLPYWDWSLDWEAPASAPVWDTTLGLGGDGDASGPQIVGDGRCVIDGPFAGLEVKYYDGEHHPHCLSRGFAPDLELRELGALIQPSAVTNMMQEPRYSQFEEDLERRAHHFLSQSVRGDLSKFTGPNDPIFFLHHTNIDRIWWQWQQLDRERRLYAYDGRASNVSSDDAALGDIMNMGGLAANVHVVDLMDTTKGQFCYVY